MPSIGPRCHELRIDDTVQKKEWRLIYYVGRQAIAVLEVFAKGTRTTPVDVIRQCQRRVAEFRKVDGSRTKRRRHGSRRLGGSLGRLRTSSE